MQSQEIGNLCLNLGRESEISLSSDEKYPEVTLSDPLFGTETVAFADFETAKVLTFVFKAASLFDETSTMSDFRQITQIGSDILGVTDLVQYSGSGIVYALRSIPKANLSNTDIASVLTTLVLPEHPFISGVALAFADLANLYVCIEYPLCGELFENTYQLKTALCEVCLAISFCHGHGLHFGGIQRENVMLGADGHARVVEFGTVKRPAVDSPDVAPEVRDKGHFGASADWWSLGAMLADPSLIEENQEDLESLVEVLMSKDRKKRHNFEKIKTHRFFAGIDWQEVLEARAVIATAKEPSGVSVCEKESDGETDLTEPPVDLITELSLLW